MTKESDSSIWVTWSLPYDSTAITPMYNHVVYLLIPSCVAILAQSLYRHRSRYKAVRVCCDTAAVSGLLWGIFLLISFDKPNKTKSAILRNVFAYGIFQAIINYCDAYMFFKSYAAVVKIGVWRTRIIFLYIWFVIILSWNTKWYLLPFFTNPTNRTYLDAFFFLDLISYYGVIFYNFVFTVGFVVELIRLHSQASMLNVSVRHRNRTGLLIGNGSLCILVCQVFSFF